MQPEVIVGLLSCFGTFLGTVGGIGLIKYRISQLEKKVDKHNNLVERMYKVEGQVKENSNDIKEIKEMLRK